MANVNESKPPEQSGGEEPSEGHASVEDVPPSGEATRLEMAPPRRRRGAWLTAPFRMVYGGFRRMRWRVLALRVVLHGINVLAVLALLAYGAIKFFVKPDDIKRLVKQVVEEQTGGKLDIGSVRFDLLTGLRFDKVEFYPPKPGDVRGYAAGGEIDPAPLANFDALDIQYSVPRMLAGRVYIKALRLVGPQFHLRQTDGVFNFASILEYRAVKFPSDPEAAPEEKTEDGTDAKPVGDSVLPFSPALLYMPIQILAQNIGVTHLRLDMIKEEQGRITQILMTNGLSVDLGLNWFGSKSAMWASVMSPFETPLEVEIQDLAEDGQLKQTLGVKMAMHTRFALDDFKRIGFDFAARLLDLRTPVAGYQDLGIHSKVRLTASDDYKGVSIEAMEANLADALTFAMDGRVTASDASFQSITLKLKQKLGVDLANAARLAKPFAPELKASGAITVEEMRIDGTVEPAKLAAAPDAIGKGDALPLPQVTGVVWLEDVWADYPGTGVSFEPVSGDVSIAAGPALSGAGSQVDTSVDLVIPSAKATRTLPVGDVTVGVDNMSVKVTARALYPDMIAPVVKINVEADHVTTSGKGLAQIDVPLYVDIDADGRQDLQRMGVTSNVELGDLAEISSMADCQNRCARFRANSLVRLDSLEKLHAIALPLGGVLGVADFMPTKMKGTVDVQFAARGRLPDPLTTPVPDLLAQADVRFNTQLNVGKVSAQVPFMKVDLRNFETRLLASGTLAQQQLDLQTRFESVKAELPPELGGGKPVPVTLERFEFSTEAQNEIKGAIDLANIMRQLKSTVFTKVNLGRVDAMGLLPRPMDDMRVTMLVAQEGLTDFKLDELRVRLPDYGVSTAVYLDTRVGPDFFPQRIDTRVTVNVAHNGGERLPAGIRTSGNVDVRLEVKSDDMKTARIDGFTSFDKFNVVVPALDGQGPPLLTVDEISGQLPFKQRVVLPELRPPNPDKSFAVAEAKAKEAEAATKAAVGKGPAVASKEALAAVPTVEILDDQDAVSASQPKTDTALASVMDRYFEKNDDKILANANVVAIVDYPTIRPFFPEKRPLAIRRVEAANLELSKMEFDVELRQNWLALNQFMIDFLGGKIQGDFQLAFDAQQKVPTDIPRGLRATMHMTRLDTRKLIERFPNLKGKSSSWDLFSNPYIDGTVHLNYDFKSNDMSGGIDITSIGKEQLRMMLYFVDPYEQNPTITSMRGKLAFGEVRKVAIPLKNGEIGMDVDVRVLSAPLPMPKLSRFPISQIIQNFKDQAVKDAAAVPGA